MLRRGLYSHFTMIPRRVKIGLLSRFLLLLSGIGFMLQVYQVANQYFRYQITTQVQLIMRSASYSHSVSLCIRYADIIDKDRLERETGIRVAKRSTLQDGIDGEAQLTISQIFKYTPAADGAIVACTFRPDSWNYNYSSDPQVCSGRFYVTKFFMQEYICYSIGEHDATAFNLTDVSRSTFSKGTMFRIVLNDSFAPTDALTPILSYGRLPYLSRDFAPVLRSLVHEDGIGIHKQFNIPFLTPSDTVMLLLPRPYETGCVNEPAVIMQECKVRCITRSLAPLNRAPGREILIETGIDMIPVTTADMNDPTLGPVIKESFDHCNQVCLFVPCRVGYTVTHARLRLSRVSSFGFYYLAPIDSTVFISAQAKMSFVDFFCFVAGCFGTWFGVSFLSLKSLAQSLFTRHRPTNVHVFVSSRVNR